MQDLPTSPWLWTPGITITGIVLEGLFPWGLHEIQGAAKPMWVRCSQPLAFWSQHFTAVVKKGLHLPWFLQCRMLSVQEASTSHSVWRLNTFAKHRHSQRARAVCKQGLSRSRGSLLAWGSSSRGGCILGQSYSQLSDPCLLVFLPVTTLMAEWPK